MRNFKNEYQKLIDSVNLNKNDYEEIKDQIYMLKKSKCSLKILSTCVTIIVIFLVVTLVANADKIVRYFKNTNNVSENTNALKQEFMVDVKLDKDYDSNLFVNDNYYKKEEIETKLNLILLKNKMLEDNLFKVITYNVKDNKIAKASFELVNISTKYDSEDVSFFVGGYNANYKYYYLKNLDTEALIIGVGYEPQMHIVDLVYDNVVYEMEFERTTSLKEIKNFLNNFTI